jgi:hypothetical protein
MPINYALLKNDMTGDPDAYVAVVEPTGTARLHDVIERMRQLGATLDKAGILELLEAYDRAIESLLLEGANVHTPTANYGLSIVGIFNGQMDTFDPDRHQLTATAAPGNRLRAEIKAQARLVRQTAVELKPHPLQYMDLSSGTLNSLLTPKGMGQIRGHRLQVDSSDPYQGVFFIESQGATTRVNVIGRNRPDELMFLIPPLAIGEYTLEVRSKVKGSRNLVTGVLEAPLTVT